MHLNFEGHFSSPPSRPSWLTQLQQQDWQRRGIVVWDVDLRIVAHLYAGYALELLEHLQGDAAWKTNGLVIGSPAYQRSSESVDGIVTLENQIELAPDQAKDVVDFLSTHKKLLEYIAIHDEEAAEDALRTVFRLIAAYGREVREGKKSDKFIETAKPNILPTFIPRGNYFTVHQAAQICHATSKQIRAWIRKGKLEALNLPGLGIIIQAEKLHEFLYQRNS
jgi:hypothetical protein